MNNSKTVKKSVAVIIAVVIAVVMAATSVVCVALTSNQSTGNTRYLKDAKSVVTEFVNNEAYNEYAYSDGLFAKANIVSECVNELTTPEAGETISKSLGLNNFIVTDPDGNIINATEQEKVGKSILDFDNTKDFKTVLKGITYKTTSEPKAVEGESGVYNVMACVTRSVGGIVIIDIDTDTYTAVTGEKLADECKGDTIIAKDGKIVSSSFDLDGANELSSLGVTDSMLKAKDFTLTVNDNKYTLSAENVEGYTVISGTVKEDSGFNYIYGAVVPAIAFAVMIVLAIVVFSAVSKVKEEIK
jgi:hypothetical protein